MKKRLLVAVTAVILLISQTSCTSQKTSEKQTSEKDTRDETIQEETTFVSETETSLNGTEYGKNTGTSSTYTGLEPLPLVNFAVSDPDNSKQLSNTTVSHSFGVAENEKANDISINYQKYFDEKSFKALTLDLKTTEKVVYLTFDVGYDNGYTGKILDTLKEKNVKAAFFCTVPEMKSDPTSIARMINEGHIVGNHTNSHPSMPSLTRTGMMTEIKECDDYLRTYFGYSSPYFRFPKGEYSDNALDLVGSLGYTSVFWSLAYEDWNLDKQNGVQYARDIVISRIHPGAVILLHAISPDNANALGSIIDSVRSMGYEFKSLDDYGK